MDDSQWLEQMAIAALYLGDLSVTQCRDGWFTYPLTRFAWEHAQAALAQQHPVFVGDLIVRDHAKAAEVMDWMSHYTQQVAPLPTDGGILVQSLGAIAQQRALKGLAEDWATLDPQEARGRLQRVLTPAEGDRHWDVSMTDAIGDFYEATTAVANGATLPVVRTGLRKLDRVLLGGFFPGDVILVGARPSTGKSAVALTMARKMAEDGKRVLFVSLEMTQRDVVARLLAPTLGEDTQILRLGDFRTNPALLSKLTAAIGPLSLLPIRIWDRSGLTLADIDHRVRWHQDHDGLDCVMIDYVQLLHRPREQNTAEELSAVAEQLKVLAKAWAVPVVAMAQINRTAEQAGDMAPELWHLKGSGGLEESADVVLLLHRPKNERRADGSGPMDIRVAKHRHGPVDTVRLWFDAVRQDVRGAEGGEYL